MREFQVANCADSDTLRFLSMQERCIFESLWSEAPAELDTSYCNCVLHFSVCCVSYSLLLTESDIFIKMMEELVFFLF